MRMSTKGGNPVKPIGFGTMPISAFYFPQPTGEQAVNILLQAFSMGYNVVDTAMVYGNNQNGDSERLVGNALKKLDRKSIFISTKCGLSFENGQVVLGGKKAHIFSDCEESLKRLQTDYIDVFFLHRIDPNTSLRESLSALVQLKKVGKIRHIGLSEVNTEQIKKAVSILSEWGEKLDFIQNEYSLTSRQDEANQVLELCSQHQIIYMAYSPLGRGLLANTNMLQERFAQLGKDDFRSYLPRFNEAENLTYNQKLVGQLETIAKEKKATVSQLSLAWLLHQGKKINVSIIPIPGTKRVEFLKENYQSQNISFTQAELEQINQLLPIDAFKGERWPSTVANYGNRLSHVANATQYGGVILNSQKTTQEINSTEGTICDLTL